MFVETFNTSNYTASLLLCEICDGSMNLFEVSGYPSLFKPAN